MIKYNAGCVSVVVDVATFPGGEVRVNIKPVGESTSTPITVHVHVSLKSSNDVMALLMTMDALKRHYQNGQFILHMMYIPYARQDRVCNIGESLSIDVFAQLINSCGFIKVLTMDAHSDVAPALIRNCINLPQSELFRQCGNSFYDYHIVAPDAGAYKKAYKLAEILGARGVICANKIRNLKDGQIVGTYVNEDVKGLKLLVADDICDGGRTFIELGKVLREKECAALELVVTHGIFSKGDKELTELFDMVYSSNSFHPEAEYRTGPFGYNAKLRWFKVI